MIRFLLFRILYSLVLVLLVLSLTFLVAKLAPGDPLSQYYSPQIDPQFAQRARHQLGLDQPLYVQYVRWLGSFLAGDFGYSHIEHRPVRSILGERVPRTLELTLLALSIQVVLGFGLGMVSAARRGSRLELALKGGLLFFYSIPSFYLAYLFIALFSLGLGLLPSAGVSSIAPPAGVVGGLADRLRHLLLPVGVLALGGAAAFARFTRGSLLDVFTEQFITTARAKGLSGRRILWVHALKNALPGLLTVLALSFPFLLGGSVVVEKIFAWPGMGALAVDAIFSRDYPVIVATTFVGALMVVVGNFMADISYMLVDPRIKLAMPRE